MTAALSGATVRQLRHWRDTQLLTPEYRTGTRVFYSYRDIIALRTFVYLRETLPLQRIRKAVGNLRSLGEPEHLSRYRLVSQGATIMLLDDAEDIDLVNKPGQTVARFDEITRAFETQEGLQIRDLARPTAYVTVDPETLGGHPVITGTRVPFEAVASLVADGVAPEDVRLFYPSVTTAAARSAVEFADYVSGFATAAAA